MVTVWADNADACSVQYAGTGALKTDFTRLVSCFNILKMCIIFFSNMVLSAFR